MVIVFVHVNAVGLHSPSNELNVAFMWSGMYSEEVQKTKNCFICKADKEDIKLAEKPLTRSSSTLKLRSSVCWYLRLSITLDGDGISLSRNDSSSGVVIPSHRQSNVFNPSLIRPGRIIGRRTNSVMATSCSVFWMVSTAGVAFK